MKFSQGIRNGCDRSGAGSEIKVCPAPCAIVGLLESDPTRRWCSLYPNNEFEKLEQHLVIFAAKKAREEYQAQYQSCLILDFDSRSREDIANRLEFIGQ